MRVVNRKARFNYELLEKFEAGIVLEGREVKSVKKGQISFSDSFVRIKDGQAWLINAHIHPYQFADNRDYQPTRSRKLLLHKKEILSLSKKMEGRNLVIVPISCYTQEGRVKLGLALAKGKKEWQKKEKIKKRDIEREVEREIRNIQ